MKSLCLTLALSLAVLTAFTQPLYFPPVFGDEWESVNPADLNWNEEVIEELYDFLDGGDSRAFMVLVDGKIAIEKYFGGFSQDSAWYWASAGKGMTAFLTGMLQSEGLLSIEDPVSTYLGEGWTALDSAKEELITLRNQLTMTSGLDYTVQNNSCTLDSCLQYLGDAGSFWYYHNAPYTLLSNVLESASGQNINTILFSRLWSRTGITGLYLPLGYNRILFSTPRSFARFGLLCLAEGIWDGNEILGDGDYFQDMVTTSQPHNLSYGYLWWLNGKDNFILPGFTTPLPGSYAPNAPDDMYAALGANGQVLQVIPSLNMVVLRMGDSPGNIAVPVTLSDEIWKYLNRILPATAISETPIREEVAVFPNPASDRVFINVSERSSGFEFELRDLTGRMIRSGRRHSDIELGGLISGLYLLTIKTTNAVHLVKLQIN